MKEKEELVRLAKELDALMPLPDSPEDEKVPVMFGEGGFIVMGDNGSPLILGTYNDPEVMFGDKSISPFANGFGHLFAVNYGALFDEDEDTLKAMRVIIGVTADGLATSVFRDLLTNEIIFIDENCEQTPFDPVLGMFE
jgi:hypothetical protein